MRAILTPDDLKKGDLVDPPGWYPAEFVDYQEEPVGKTAKNQGSVNCLFYFKITADGPNKGITVRVSYNETALSYGKALWAVMFGKADPVKGYEVSTEAFKAKLGLKLKIYVKRGKNQDNGKEFNELFEFLPAA